MPYPGRANGGPWRDNAHYRGGWSPGGAGPWHEDFSSRPPGFRLSARARLIVPVVLSLLVQLPPALFWLFHLENRTPTGYVTLALALLGPLALLAARRFPGPVVVFVSAAACIDFLLADPTQGPPYLALAFAIVGAIARGARVWAWISVGVCWTATLVGGLLIGLDWHPARIAVTTLGILIVFGIGEAVRTRREHFEEYRRTIAQRKLTEVQAERVRIARELHDVLAHSLSQINVQAGVGLHLMDKQPAKAAEALASIKETSKTALDEVRSVLGMLRAENGDPDAPLVPEPNLSRLPGLAASVTSQGVDVALSNSVDDAPQAVQLAVYRIVQESLTNVLRHANATRATVDVRAEAGHYVVTIGDDGTGIQGDPDSGRGLLGMRERAELLGGTLDVSRAPQGGVLITARIPKKEDLA
ncbi:MAG: sensor histidine kinase [Rhodoglobus sp.]|nr:sensor histidine kinase [Rhodoglobus sp.]